MLQITKLRKCFHKNSPDEHLAIKDLDLHLNPGDFVSIIGSNGAGKSTLLNLIAGAIQADQGSIRLDGEELSQMPEHQRARVVGRVFQETKLGTAGGMSLIENLSMAARRGKHLGLRWGLPKAERPIFQALLAEVQLGLEDRLDDKASALSGGQRQALSLIMAMIKAPKLLLLDEHTAALDPKTSERLMERTERMLQDSAVTTLMITHNMHDAIRYGNRLIMMDEGQIILDCSGEAKTRCSLQDLMEAFSQHEGPQQGVFSDRSLLKR